MRRTMVLALGLLVMPAAASAQVELGLDFFGLTYTDQQGPGDAAIGVGLPMSGMRVGFAAGEQMTIETRMEVDWDKQGDASATSLMLVPGLNYLVTPQIYVRGEAGLQYFKADNGTISISGTQYLFGGAVGSRRALGSGALLRMEAGVAKALENTDDGIPSSLTIHGSVGVSAVIGG